MSDQTFQEAYARVRNQHSDRTWFALTPREIADLIYREMREIDRERVEKSASGCGDVAIAAE